MNFLQLNYRFKWQTIAKKMSLTILSLSALSYEATAAVLSLPATIQAENYFMMRGIGTTAAKDIGNGLYVGWTDTTDWLSFASIAVKIPVTGNYKITYRVASLAGGGSFTFREINNGPVYDKVYVPRTGSGQTWTNVSRTITLPAGIHKFGMTVITGGFNINWFKIERLNVVSSSSKAASSSKSTPAQSKPIQSKAASSSRSSDTGSVHIAGPVGISWGAPKVRENGKGLDITEVGGYKIRYKLSSAANFTYITINDAWTNFYNFSWLEGNYIFEIAAFDKSGRHSDYVDILKK